MVRIGGREKKRRRGRQKGVRRRAKKTQARCRPLSTSSCAKRPPTLTLLSLPSLSLSKRRKMAVAAASTGTAEAAKGLIEAEAMVERVRLGEANFSTRNGRFQRVRARRERVSEMQDPAGGGASAGEGPHRRRKEGKAKTNCGERSKVFFFFFSLSSPSVALLSRLCGAFGDCSAAWFVLFLPTFDQVCN